MNHHPILVYSNVFRFLRLKILENAKNSSKDLGLEVLQKNFNYYRDNLREVLKDAKIRGIEVILTSLPGLFEVGDKNNFSDYPQFIGLTQQEIEYRQSVVILINDLKKKLAGEYTHVSYVDNGTSPRTLGKSDFFSDTTHPTGAGNRILAYQLFKYLNN
jgi:lysophospholipase L1-like esterase